ncbi:MAG: ATP-dependent Clp protease adapter ClpS [Deltaproteobacteria bacterium]|nr:ATP-dependent Clp protease adapter ClpS [Deltaproteobacteria bacterium]
MSESKTIETEQPEIKEQPRFKEPPLFEVLLINDDYTTMDFVIEVLEVIFHKNEIQATTIMLNVHRMGTGVAGVYPRDLAETKTAMVHDWARHEGHPLRCAIKKV